MHPLRGGCCSHEEAAPHLHRRPRDPRPRPRGLGREQRAADSRLRLGKEPTVATIEYPTARLSAAPAGVSDEFVLELRTSAARNPALPIRHLTGREVAAVVRYALAEDKDV